MIDMPQIQSIRRMHQDGYKIAEIAKTLKLSWPTVKKYIEMDDFNQPMPQEQRRPSKLDPYKEIVMTWLEEDKKVWRKQHHTALRVYDRLIAETDYTGSYSLVQRFLKEIKAQNGSTGFLDLVWEPAEVQVDFGQADLYIYGVLTRMHYLVVTFPYSNVAIAQLFKGENAECVCMGLKRIFEYVGGVPRRAVLDNGAGIGKKIYDEIRLTELFARFQLHYKFEVTLCNPDSGNEKGNVENAVGTLRRNLFVPVPDIHDVDTYNKMLLDECMDRASAVHYRKGERGTFLFEEDCYALSPLPEKPFACVRYQEYRTDKYGNVCIGGCHRYSTSSKLALQKVIVGFGADDIDIYSLDGTHISTHGRLYGERPEESIDPQASLRLLMRRPGGWQNSMVRMSLPESLKDYIDAQDKDLRKECLATLAEVTEATDYATAIEACWNVCQRIGYMKRSDVVIYAERLYGNGAIDYDEPVDLGEYDQVFANMKAVS